MRGPPASEAPEGPPESLGKTVLRYGLGWLYTGRLVPTSEEWAAAREAAGESYLENAPEAHERLERLSQFDPTPLSQGVNAALLALEGNTEQATAEVWGIVADRAGDKLMGRLEKAAGGLGLPAERGLGAARNSAGELRIINKRLAGQTHPVTKVPFDADGFPDFSNVATKRVYVKQVGTDADAIAANRAAGLAATPKGYTWHHHQDGETMLLVPSNIHLRTGHTGGAAFVRRQAREEGK